MGMCYENRHAQVVLTMAPHWLVVKGVRSSDGVAAEAVSQVFKRPAKVAAACLKGGGWMRTFQPHAPSLNTWRENAIQVSPDTPPRRS